MKSSFSRLVVSPHPKDEARWILCLELVFHWVNCGRIEDIRIPAQFTTDFASVPRWLWVVVAPHGRHIEAAVLHDWLYFCGGFSRPVCDAIFLEAMKASGVPTWRRWAMYYAVRIGGGEAWRTHRKLHHNGQQFTNKSE